MADNTKSISRRKWLSTIGAGAGVVLAGCSGGDGGDGGSDGDGGDGGSDGDGGDGGSGGDGGDGGGEMTETTSSGGPYNLGFAAMAAPSPWHQIWMKSHKWYAQDQGHEMIVTNAEFDATTQTEQVQSMLNKGIDGLIMSPVSSGGMVDLVENVVSQDVPVMTNNSTVFSKEIPIWVAFGNYSGGYLAGKKVAAKVNDLYGGGRVIDVMGNQTSATAQQRSQGFTDAVEEEGLTVAKHIAAKWSVEQTIQKTTAFLQQDDDIQGMYGAWGAASEGMRKALERQGMLVERGNDGYIPTGVIDATPVAVKNIREGFTEVAVDQPMPFYAPITIHFMTNYLDAGKDPSVLPEMGAEIGAGDIDFTPESTDGGPEGHTKLWQKDYWAPAEVESFSNEGTEYHKFFKMQPLAVTKENVEEDFLWAKHTDLL